ncbi:MAG: hypothetical protein EBX50_13680 [Chitinophagia bacterium]|nr:hypothetical protein [Chitinophagia bacterium]
MFTTLANFFIEKYTLKGKAAGLSLEDIAKKHNVNIQQLQSQLDKGIKVEHEHTGSTETARTIAMDHLFENPKYYDKLAKAENAEGITTTGGVLPWKEVPQEEKNKAYELLKAHNDAVVNPASGPENYYFIDVTGKHQVYYTFWRFRILPNAVARYIKNPIYFGNLSTDIVSSVQKAISKSVVKNVVVKLYGDQTREHLIGRTKATPKFTFGKYRGKSFPDVYLEDPGYFAFLAKNADPKYAQTDTAQAIQAFAQMYFDDVTKKNQETSTTQFVGKPGDRFEGELELYNVKVVPGTPEQGGYNVYKLKDAQGNKFITYKFPTDQIGAKMKVRAKIQAHKEILGVKFNKIGYIKPI